MTKTQEYTSNLISDQHAATYGLAFDVNFTQFLKYLLLTRFTKPGDTCLDIGIANGIFAIPLSKEIHSIHGVDVSSKMLEECGKNIANAGATNIHIHEQSATDLSFDDASFDVVFSYSTLLLVPGPEQAYREITRVLKPGGVAILDITGKHNLSRIFWARYYQKCGHFVLNYYALPEIQAIFAGLGLEVLETHATGLLDQWKYIPLLGRLKFIDTITHRQPRQPDLDYRLSQRLPRLANRWYFVLRKIHP